MYNTIADKLKSFGGILRCTVCNYEEPINKISGQLETGWKKCCGYTMRWVTKKELEEEQSK